MDFFKGTMTVGVAILSVCGGSAFANEAIQYIKPVDGPKVIGPYSPGVVADLSQGKLLFVAGQLPIVPETGERISSSVQAATRQVLENVERILKASGSSVEHVLRADVFLKDMKDFAAMNEEYAKFFPADKVPARQTTQSDIPVLVEISCIAFVPNQ